MKPQRTRRNQGKVKYQHFPICRIFSILRDFVAKFSVVGLVETCGNSPLPAVPFFSPLFPQVQGKNERKQAEIKKAANSDKS